MPTTACSPKKAPITFEAFQSRHFAAGESIDHWPAGSSPDMSSNDDQLVQPNSLRNQPGDPGPVATATSGKDGITLSETVRRNAVYGPWDSCG